MLIAHARRQLDRTLAIMSSGGVCIVNDAAAEFVSTASIASLGLRCKTSSAIVPDMLASRAGVTVACLLWRPGACDQSR